MITVSKITKLRPAAVPGSVMAQMNPGPECEVTQIRVQLECGNGSTAIIATATEATPKESASAVLRQLAAQVDEARRQIVCLGLLDDVKPADPTSLICVGNYVRVSGCIGCLELRGRIGVVSSHANRVNGWYVQIPGYRDTFLFSESVLTPVPCAELTGAPEV